MHFHFGFLFWKPLPSKGRLLPRLAACAVLAAASAAAQIAPSYAIDTIAGPGDLMSSAADQVKLNTPRSVAVDRASNVYIADRLNDRILKVDAAGNTSTFAGTETRGYSGDGGPATAAQLFSPEGVAVDDMGNVYIADTNNNRIRKVDTAGIISTLAGTGEDGYSGDGGPAAEAQLSLPFSVAADGAGNIYIAGNDRIRKVDAVGNISTFAGIGIRGYIGDGGPATAARLNAPQGVAADAAGNVYIADTGNNRIRRVDAAGVIATVAGTGIRGYSGDSGPAVSAYLHYPAGVAADSEGNIYIADTENHRIRKVGAEGNISTVAGSAGFGLSGDGGPATAAEFVFPADVAVDSAGNLYIADTENHRIRRVDARGYIATFAGAEAYGFSGDGGPSNLARLNFPQDAAVDGVGNVYIADTFNHRIRKVDANGYIATFAGTGIPGYSGNGGPAAEAQLNIPEGVAVDGIGNVYIADTGNNRIRKVGADGNTSTVAGGGNPTDGVGDGGPATAARLSSPQDVAVDGDGNIYIADTHNGLIRRVSADGNISTFAGVGTLGYGGDGGPATKAYLNWPQDVAMDGDGNIYIADRSNDNIRKVGADGIISTVAGGGNPTDGVGDGGPATAARLSSPQGVAVDGNGNIYIADNTYNGRIRRVSADGNISTVAGGGNPADGVGDGGPATAARLDSPQDVAVDSAGNVYIADAFNHRIRRLRPKPRISVGGIVLATGTPTVSRISPNALISVFGQDFASQGTSTLNPRLDAPDKVAADLAETCLEIGGKRTPLFLVAPNQINAQAPHDLPPGQTQAAVVRDCGADSGLRGEAVTVATAAVSPAFFNVLSNPDGHNPVIALHGGGPALVGAPDLLPGTEFSPAVPGEFVTLFGTGFGAVEPPLEAGQIPGAAAVLANAAAFTVGGIAVPPEDVLYAGASPCCAGLYQFTLRVPPDIPDGDAAVTATVSGISTPKGPFLTVRGAGADAPLGVRRF